MNLINDCEFFLCSENSKLINSKSQDKNEGIWRPLNAYNEETNQPIFETKKNSSISYGQLPLENENYFINRVD